MQLTFREVPLDYSWIKREKHPPKLKNDRTWKMMDFFFFLPESPFQGAGGFSAFQPSNFRETSPPICRRPRRPRVAARPFRAPRRRYGCAADSRRSHAAPGHIWMTYALTTTRWAFVTCYLVGGWTHLLEKYELVKLDHFPKILGVKIKIYLICHHLGAINGVKLGPPINGLK